jgi:hypothetical protein
VVHLEGVGDSGEVAGTVLQEAPIEVAFEDEAEVIRRIEGCRVEQV